MSHELPKGWVFITLGDYTDFKKGKKPKDLFDQHQETLLPYIDIKAFEKGIFRQYASAGDGVIAKENDCLMVWDGARSGLVGKSVEGIIGSTLMLIKPRASLPEYFYYFLKSQFQFINGNTKGTGIPHVDPAKLWSIQYPVPPRNEQIRIANKLDNLLAKVDAAQTHLEKIPTLLKRFRQSVLAAATSGELTREWRQKNHGNVSNELIEIEKARTISFEADAVKHFKRTKKKLRPYDFSTLNEPLPHRDIPLTWEIVELGKLISVLTDYHANGSYEVLKDKVTLQEKEDYACMIRATNFEKNNFNDLLTYISKEAYEFLGKSQLFGREILVGKIGNAGFVYHMPILNRPASLAMNLFALRFNEELISSSYIYIFLKSGVGEQNIQKYVRGVATKSIDKKSLRSVFINLPPHEEQKEIGRRVESLFTLADSVEKQYLAAKKRTGLLTQSLLAKAFRGELVPQDLNDVPASELLNRIQAEREQQTASKPKRKISVKK